MKPFTKTLLIAILIIVVLLSACNSDCPKKATLAYLNSAADIINRFNRTNEIAASTARIGLAPIVSELRIIQTELEDLSPPTCANAISFDAYLYTDQTIAGYLAFMQQEDDATISENFDQATSALERFVNNTVELRDRWEK
jgi:hypothetical protein